MIVRSAGGSMLRWTAFAAILLWVASRVPIEGAGVPAVESTNGASLVEDERNQLPGSLRRKRQVRNRRIATSTEETSEVGMIAELAAIDDIIGSLVPTRAPQQGPRPTRSPSAPVAPPTPMPQGAVPTAKPISIATEAPTDSPVVEPTASPTAAPNPEPTPEPSLIPIPLPPSVAPVAVVR
jgi:hypothetical protein